MSYSINIKGRNKDEAKAALRRRFDTDVMTRFKVHARDRAAVFANADAVIDILDVDESKDISVSINGYLSVTVGDEEKKDITAAGIACAAGLVERIS